MSIILDLQINVDRVVIQDIDKFDNIRDMIEGVVRNILDYAERESVTGYDRVHSIKQFVREE